MQSKRGVVEGNGDGTFAPDDAVTYAQAIKMLVVAIGYKPNAERVGGYPIGYVTVAAQQGVTKGITAVVNDPVKVKDVRILVDNALSTPVLEQTVFGAQAEYQSCNGENGVDFKTLETQNFNRNSFYVTGMDNGIILTHKDVKDAVVEENQNDGDCSLRFTLTDEGKEKLAKATEEIVAANKGEGYIKVIAGVYESFTNQNGEVDYYIGAPVVIAKPTVNAKIDSGEFVVQGQFDRIKAEAIISAIKNYEAE